MGNSYTTALQIDRSKVPARIQAGKIFSKTLEEQADKIMADAATRFMEYQNATD